MTADTTALLPWQRLHDIDWMARNVFVWATLLRRADEVLEDTERQLRDLPGAREADDMIAEARQLVGIVEEEIRPLSVYLQAGPSND